MTNRITNSIYYFLSACLSQNALKCIVWCLKTNLAGLRLIIAEFLKSWYVPCVGFACLEALAIKQSHHSISWSVDRWLFSLFNAVQHHCATLFATQCQLTWHCKDTVTVLLYYQDHVFWSSKPCCHYFHCKKKDALMSSDLMSLSYDRRLSYSKNAHSHSHGGIIMVSLQSNYFEYYQWNLSASILFCDIFQHHKWMNGCSIFLHVTST